MSAKLLGNQSPRILSVPEFGESLAGPVVKLAAAAGLKLFPWQKLVLEHALREDDYGKWTTSQVGLIVPRQNGKGGIIEALELAWLFLFKEELILHSAHKFNTAADAYKRITALIKAVPEFEAQVAKFNNTNGKEGIELVDGRELKFIARSSGSGRGFPAKKMILDESYELGEAEIAALLPTLTAAVNPQTWFISTPVNAEQHRNGRVLAKIRRRGISQDPRLAYFEWSATEDMDPADPKTWAYANPSFGRTIDSNTLRDNRGAMSAKTFAVEHLGIGDWPAPEDEVETVVDMALWGGLERPTSKIVDRRIFAVEVARMGARASISVSGLNDNDRYHVELVDNRPGIDWVIPRLKQLRDRWNPIAFVVDVKSGGGGLALDMESAGLPVMMVDTVGVAQAFSTFITKVAGDKSVRHIGQPALTDSLEGATTRTIGEGGAMAWDRKNAAVDLTPIVSATYALWGFTVKQSQLVDAAGNVW